MRRAIVAFAVVAGLFVAYALAHWALIETAREVIVLRTEEPDGRWIDELLRTKYGLADRWFRLVGPDDASTTPVRLEGIS